MSYKDGSVKVVVTAIIVNFFVTVAKLVGWFFSPNPSMLAEAIHSFADTANQSLVYLGITISKKAPTREFPAGYGQARYLWNLISASGIFFIGFGVTVYHGVTALINPHHDEPVSYGLGIGVLIFAFIVEGYALLIAYKEVSENKGSKPLGIFLRESDDPTSVGVLLEDAVAVLGVLLALIGMAMSYTFHTHIPDAIASILIGVLLGFLAIVIAYTNGRLLINKSVGIGDEKEIREFILKLDSINDITVFKTEILAPREIKLSIEIDFDATLMIERLRNKSFPDIVHVSVKEIGHAINLLEKQIQGQFPNIKYIDLEIN